MMLPPLKIIPAGAGSGKTYSIQQQLGDWVVDGLVAPERIVAVTFTEAAAAELRERIRAKLLDLGRLEDALKLDQAYISTIHGFGLRLLTEFAFDAGSSPSPRLLNEDEESALIRLSLSKTNKAKVITSNLKKFGYSFSFHSKKSAEDMFRDDLLRIVMLLRSAGWNKESDDYAELATNWIRERYGFARPGEKLTANLHRAVTDLIEAYPESLVESFGNSKAAKDAFRKDFRNLNAAINKNTLSSDWKLWKGLRELRLSKKGCNLPDDYDQLGGVVIEAANALPEHEGPLEQAEQHISALIEAGQDVLVRYAQAKREAGLVDYGDMIAMTAELLRTKSTVLATLVSRIDCLVVDEFQDTNPLQFDLLWQLKNAGVPTVTVGDLKQAIMGFQGADPRLFNALIEQNQDIASPLTRNWRSQPDLMQFINAVGPILFEEAYVPLAPQGAISKQEPLELIKFAKRAKSVQHKVRALSVSDRLQVLLEDPTQQVIDKRTKKSRRLRGGDIAVLCPTNTMLSDYATTLRSMGLRVRLQEGGWHESRIIQLACQALAYVTNPQDRHAALYLSVTELGNLDLQPALEQLITNKKIDDPVLDQLDALADDIEDRTIFALVSDIFSALNLFDIISTWPDADQARANLLRLQAEAGEFMDANREALASGGYYGSGVQSFLAWLNAKVEQKDKNNQPDPRVIDEDAIQLATWHKSKGREWPVVFVCGMDRPLKSRLPDMSLGYDSFDDLSALIEKAQIEYSPEFSAPEVNEKFLGDLRTETELESKRLIYVALTRAREKLVIEWPSFLEGKDTLTYWSIMSDGVTISEADKKFIIGESEFDCLISQGRSELPEEADLPKNTIEAELLTVGRRAITPGQFSGVQIPDSKTPSAMKPTQSGKATADVTLETISYSEGLSLDIGVSGTELGSFLHQCFEILGASANQTKNIASITGVEVSEDYLSAITQSVASFEQWIASYFEATVVYREQPLLGIDNDGSVVSGIADLVIETEKGVWIIDHKSDSIGDPEEGFSHYKPQLLSYAELLESMGKIVLGIGINWIRLGETSLRRFSRK